MSFTKNFYANNKVGIIITMIVLIIGSIVYFGFGFSESNASKYSKIFDEIKVKVDYTPEGNLKLFANTKNNELSKIKAFQGQNIPESDSMIIGYDEAMMMRNEKLFTNVNDEIKGLFGLDIKVGGILKKTDTIIDDIHFLSEGSFNKIEGDENKVFIISEDDGAATFLTYKNDENEKIKFVLKEGNLENYKNSEIDGKKYYPILLGFKEAQMMKEEKEFDKIGDILEEEGKEFILVGIVSQTNTSLDMMHIISLTKEELEN